MNIDAVQGRKFLETVANYDERSSLRRLIISKEAYKDVAEIIQDAGDYLRKKYDSYPQTSRYNEKRLIGAIMTDCKAKDGNTPIRYLASINPEEIFQKVRKTSEAYLLICQAKKFAQTVVLRDML